MYELLALPHSPGVIQAPYAVPKGSSRAQIQGQGSVVLLKDPKNRTCKKKIVLFFWYHLFWGGFFFVCLLGEVCLVLLLILFFTKPKKIFLPEILFRITCPENLHCRLSFDTWKKLWSY